MNSSNIQSRLAEDKDLFAIYDVLKSTKLNTVLDSSQMRIGLSLNRIRNYLFSYDVIFCISTNKNNDIVEIAAFELSPQMFVGNEVKLFYWGYSTGEPRTSFIMESFVLIKKLLGINYVNLYEIHVEMSFFIVWTSLSPKPLVCFKVVRYCKVYS